MFRGLTDKRRHRARKQRRRYLIRGIESLESRRLLCVGINAVDGDSLIEAITLTNSGSCLGDIAISRSSVNGGPTISDVEDQSVSQDNATAALAIMVGDLETTPASLSVVGSSANPTLVPDANIVVSGTGADRTVVVTPASGQLGTAIITLTVTDDDGLTAVDIFTLTVNETPGGIDFGDAPSGYPVTLAEDGARHTTTSLFLGAGFDSEAEGQPSEAADADAADDGVFVIADAIVVAGTMTTSSFSVIASEAGFLDAWIDFNRDGDWADAGEQIATRLTLTAGRNVLSYAVPTDASVGDTVARFRISNNGSLAPTGAADSGEVEDYIASISDGIASPGVLIDLFDLVNTVIATDGSVAVRSGATDLFQVPLANLGDLAVFADPVNSVLTLDFSGGDITPAGGLIVDGVGGSNRLVIVNAVDTITEIDVTDSALTVAENFDQIDLSGDGTTMLTLDDAAVSRLTPTSNSVEVIVDAKDTVLVKRPGEWRLNDPQTTAGSVSLTAVHTDGDGEEIRLVGSNGWNNFLQSSDVNNNGEITALDALVIINELGAQGFSDENGVLVDPASVTNFPDFYDQNNDLKVTALDALRVINELARFSPDPEFVGRTVNSEDVFPATSGVGFSESRLPSANAGEGSFRVPNARVDTRNLSTRNSRRKGARAETASPARDGEVAMLPALNSGTEYTEMAQEERVDDVLGNRSFMDNLERAIVKTLLT
ncbi:MAG: GEVED domain-containing protein [Rubripirellula sp.]